MTTLKVDIDNSQLQFEVIEHPRSNENEGSERDGTLGTLDWDEGEFALICRVLNSFYAYGLYEHRMITDSRRKSFFALPARHQALLTAGPFKFLDRFQEIEDAIDSNANCSVDILGTGLSWANLGGLIPATLSPLQYSSSQTSKPAFAPGETTEQDFIEWAKPNLPRISGLDKTDSQKPSAEDMSKVASTIRHLYREWSAEGSMERDACFKPILQYIVNHYSHAPQYKWHEIKVLNPGCGLGRLIFELAALGFTAEGCEISYHMLICAFHFLNVVHKPDTYTVYPWVLSGSNHLGHANRMRSARVPDVSIAGVMHEATVKLNELMKSRLGEEAIPGENNVPTERLGIASGDFSTVYKGEMYAEKYDVVAMCFFLDTAKNPLSYIETVANCLKTNGLWINHGPLKWHFEGPPSAENSTLRNEKGTKPSTPSSSGESSWSAASDMGIGNPGSVELTEEDIISLLPMYGFEVIKYQRSSKTRGTGYIWDYDSLETLVYFPSFWVAKKVGKPKIDVGELPYESRERERPRRNGAPLGENEGNIKLKMKGNEETPLI